MKTVTPYRILAVAGFALALIVFLIGQTGTTSDAVYVTWMVLIGVGLVTAVVALKLDDRARRRHLAAERRRRLASSPSAPGA